MCMYGNISMTEFIKAGHSLTGDFPLTWVDYLIICSGVLLAMLGFGLNSFIIFVLGSSVPSSYDLVQINLAVGDAVIHTFLATFPFGEFLSKAWCFEHYLNVCQLVNMSPQLVIMSVRKVCQYVRNACNIPASTSLSSQNW